MTGVSKTLSGSSILSSPVCRRLEVLGKQAFLAFCFSFRSLQKLYQYLFGFLYEWYRSSCTRYFFRKECRKHSLNTSGIYCMIHLLNYHFTITVQTTFFVPALTVIFAVPFFTPLITPLELTVATDLFDVLYVTLLWLVIGATTGFNVKVFPFFTSTFEDGSFREEAATAPFCTLTLIDFFKSLFKVMVIVALPVLLCAVIVQVPFVFPDTFTTFVLLDFHDFTESPFANVTRKAVVFCLTCMVKEDCVTEMVFLSFSPLNLISEALHFVQVLFCFLGANTVAEEIVFHAPQV